MSVSFCANTLLQTQVKLFENSQNNIGKIQKISCNDPVCENIKRVASFMFGIMQWMPLKGLQGCAYLAHRISACIRQENPDALYTVAEIVDMKDKQKDFFNSLLMLQVAISGEFLMKIIEAPESLEAETKTARAKWTFFIEMGKASSKEIEHLQQKIDQYYQKGLLRDASYIQVNLNEIDQRIQKLQDDFETTLPQSTRLFDHKEGA